MAYTKLSYPRSVEKTGYYLNFYAYDYNKAQSLGVKSIRDMLQETGGMLVGDNADMMQNLSIEDQMMVLTLVADSIKRYKAIELNNLLDELDSTYNNKKLSDL